MKELSIEEKAKAYDEAKLRMSKAFNDNRCSIGFMNEIFPELAESEDERIKKTLIHIVKGACYKYGIKYQGKEISEEKLLDWIEKQGNLIKYYEDKLDRCACENFNKGYKKALEKQGEKKIVWSEEDEAMLDTLIRRLEGEDVYVDPHLAVECLKSLKERIQPKQEWSKEDEYYYTKLENFLDVRSHYEGKSQYQDEVKETLNWLKSLRPQNHWKPSEEQMEELHNVFNDTSAGWDDNVIESLYNDLKKLKG